MHTIKLTKQGRAIEWSVLDGGEHVASGYCRNKRDAESDAMCWTAPRMANKAMPKVHWLRFDWSDHAGEAGGWTAESQCGRYEAVVEPIGRVWRFWIVRMEDGETMFDQEVPCAS